MDDDRKLNDSTVVEFGEGSTLTDRTSADRKELQIVGLSLVVIEGPDTGKEYPITYNRMTIGRKSTDIILSDPKVSRKHSELEVLGRGYYFIKDLASSNGTLVNGVQISNQRINPFDKIKVGNTVLTLMEK